MASFEPLMREFFTSARFAVAGASSAPHKFGNKLMRWYIERKLPVTPINPTSATIESISCVPALSHLPDAAHTSLSVVTPPKVTLQLLQEANQLGIPYVWLQPGSEDEQCVRFAREQKMKVIYGGPCVLRDGDALLPSKL
ncbi:uncharacterized protein VTP21DRAFT_9941 [Calcarisporiella thermophila]|uniref:uncharacterized protein n=1 Tax=Calcarisporiella thermophila TaxID=911321 RepID=UPI003743444C